MPNQTTDPTPRPASELRDWFRRGIPTEHDAWLMSLDALASAERREAELQAFKDAVIDALVCACIYETAHETDPRKALNDLLVWDGNVALDPTVSTDARELIERNTAPLNATIASQAAQIAGLEAALTRIAAFDDEGGNELLAAQGSYSRFDEPGAVQVARAALAATTETKP